MFGSNESKLRGNSSVLLLKGNGKNDRKSESFQSISLDVVKSVMYWPVSEILVEMSCEDDATSKLCTQADLLSISFDCLIVVLDVGLGLIFANVQIEGNFVSLSL